MRWKTATNATTEAAYCPKQRTTGLGQGVSSKIRTKAPFESAHGGEKIKGKLAESRKAPKRDH